MSFLRKCRSLLQRHTNKKTLSRARALSLSLSIMPKVPLPAFGPQTSRPPQLAAWSRPPPLPAPPPLLSMHMWDMNHLCVGHGPFICGTWLTHVGQDLFICGTWFIHMWDMTHSYAEHDSFICRIWLIHMRDRTYSYVGHDSFTCGTCLICVWDLTTGIAHTPKYECAHCACT